MDLTSLLNAQAASEASIITWSASGAYPTVFTRDDVTSETAWIRLYNKDSGLEETDFTSLDQFYRYLFLVLKLLDYSMIIIAGDEGGGKSLLMAWITYNGVRLFPPKRAAMDWKPPRPELYGNHFSLNDDNFVQRLQKDINKVAQYKDEPSQEIKDSIAFNNVVFGLDEGDSYGESDYQTNTTRLILRVSKRRRHFDTSMIMVYVDPMDVPGKLYRRRTHEVSCMYEYKLPGWCSYLIMHRKTGIYRYLHLYPPDWADIWNTKSWVSVSHDFTTTFTGKKKKSKDDDSE